VNAVLPNFGCLNGGIAVAEALRRVLDLVAAPLSGEHVSIADCAGRILAEPVRARFDLPGFDQSAKTSWRSPRITCRTSFLLWPVWRTICLIDVPLFDGARTVALVSSRRRYPS
jgi:hypothetical protein